MASLTNNRRATTFLDLPPEIRNDIYEMYCRSYKSDMEITICHAKVATDFPFPITKVSHQVRRETLPVCWSLPVFAFNLYYRDDVRTCKEWINVVSEEALAGIRLFRFSGYAWVFSVDLKGSGKMQSHHQQYREECERAERVLGRILNSLQTSSGKHVMTKPKLAEIIDILVKTGPRLW